MSAAPALTLIDAVKRYPGADADAVGGVSLEVRQGELVVFVGPSGCGKSTLLRMIAGLESATSGEVAIEGRTVNEVEPAHRDIAMVFQNYALYPHMSVFDNLAYGLRNRRTPKAEIERRVTEAAELLQISDFLRRKPRQLSGGQRQRVAMGRAIVREPKLFLFDEPLSNLDAKLRNQMRLEIKALQRRLGVAAIYVTHDQVEAMTLADRIVVLNNGLVEQIGAPADVYARPATTFAASFIGAPPMNLLAGEVRNGQAIVGEAVLGPAPPSTPDGPVTLGFRAEEAQIAEPGNGPALRIDLIEELGATRLIHGALEQAPEARVTLSTASRAEPSGPVALRLGPQALHLFNPADGRRI